MTIRVQVERATRITLQLDEETAQFLSAALYNSLNFSRNPWAHALAGPTAASWSW